MSLNTTVLNDAIALLAPGNTFNKYENRIDEYAAYKYHQDNSNILLTESLIESIKNSERQPTKIPVLNKTVNPSINVRSCDIAVPDSVSEFYTLTYVTLGFTAGISKALNVDNYISAEEQLADQIKSGIISVMGDLESLAIASLEAGKTTNFASTVYANNGSEYTLTQAEKDGFYKNLPAVMRRQVLGSNVYDDIANTEAATLQTFLQAQGAANSENSEYQFTTQQRYNFYRTNGIVPGGGIEETHYVAAPGSAGVYQWIDNDAKMRNAVNEGNKWDVMSDPIMNMDWGVYYKRNCVDKSAEAAGYQRTLSEAWEFTSDFAFVTARNSADDTSIVKFTIDTV